MRRCNLAADMRNRMMKLVEEEAELVRTGKNTSKVRANIKALQKAIEAHKRHCATCSTNDAYRKAGGNR